ncbi:MAG: TatD family nuclease-associated radical SAM protein [Candidatus Margulisbacteria bacterium]|jgi:TatD DNase family protein|nr:TatD family nuclease-associated radical SAM protein [Candidatus Margulisiibacteriota bacterium]
MSAIAYPVGNSLYLNITNRCTNECPFCIRNKSPKFNQQFALWLDKEPTADELITAIGDPTRYEQIVFCGYGEPTVRLEVIKEVSRQLKSQKSKLKSNVVIRIDTNGHGNLFWGRNILPELKGLIDKVSVSLNAQDAATYNRLCRPLQGERAYTAIIDFLKEAKKYLPDVEATVVDLPGVDKEKCRQIAAELGVQFRIRPYYEETYVK